MKKELLRLTSNTTKYPEQIRNVAGLLHDGLDNSGATDFVRRNVSVEQMNDGSDYDRNTLNLQKLTLRSKLNGRLQSINLLGL